MKLLLWLAFVSVFFLLIKSGKTSECDFQFTYESKNPDPKGWFGKIHLTSDVDIHGMWLELAFDKTVKFFQIWDGTLVYTDLKHFFVSNDNFLLKANTPGTIRFFVLSQSNKPISKPTSIWFNHQKVCIEDLDKVVEPAADREVTVAITSLTQDSPQESKDPPNRIVLKIEFPSTSDKESPSTRIAIPCPIVFLFKPKDPNSDQRSGDIVLYSPVRLRGIRLQMTFDKPVLEVQSSLGEAIPNSSKPHTYIFENSMAGLQERIPKLVQFSIKYNRFSARLAFPFRLANITEPPPELLEVRLNDEQVCTRDGVGSSHLRIEPPAAKTSGMVESETDKVMSKDDLVQFKPNQNGQTLNSENKVADGVCGSTTDTDGGKFPWHASLYHNLNGGLVFLCAASLISKWHVITVAHCLHRNDSLALLSPKNILISLGELHSDGQMERHEVSQVIPYPDFNVETYANDLALVKLSVGVRFTDAVKPVCLWKNVSPAGFTEAGAIVGRVIDKTGKLTNELAQVPVLMEMSYFCVDFLASHLRKYALQKTFVGSCVNDALDCIGNVGESMVYARETVSKKYEWQLQGLVMFGVVLKNQESCEKDRYVVFVEVARYLYWIQQTMEN